MRPHFQVVLDELNLLAKLTAYEPTVIGTPPLGIDIDSSDIDIACNAANLEAFTSDMTARFASRQDFVIENISVFPDPAVRVAFLAHDWEVELFCQTLPIQDQHGVRHFRIEKRLLKIDPTLRLRVRRLKQAGQKTEPAFAALLRLDGDPYEALLALEECSDEDLRRLIADGLSDAS